MSPCFNAAMLEVAASASDKKTRTLFFMAILTVNGPLNQPAALYPRHRPFGMTGKTIRDAISGDE
jgi:hypothetical protein